MNLPYFNNTSYPLAVKTQIAKLDYNDEEKALLNFHQFIPHKFFTLNPHLRGLLFIHMMGMGKTRLAVAIAEHFRKHDPHRRINVLLPKSLEGNFKSTIAEYSKQPTAEIDKYYRFVSLNASNMYKQISNVHKSYEEIEYEKRLGTFMDDVIKQNSLNDTLLIVDEAHNLFNAVTNGAKNAVQLYDLIISAKNIKIIFLTGTPIVNDPFELVPCFNMLRGPMSVEFAVKVHRETQEKQKHKSEPDQLLFSESYEEFNDYFVDNVNKKIKNRDKFASRIYGLVSYYDKMYFPENEKKENFPEELKTIVERVKMSNEQFAAYSIARNLEQEETKKKGHFGKDERFSASKSGSSTYKVKSRQISNYLIPEYALGPIRGAKARQKFIDKIKANDLLDTKTFSPKMGKIIENIQKYPDQLSIVYSQFVSGEGIGVFAKILELKGYVDYLEPEEFDAYDVKKKQFKKFAVLSGQISSVDRAKIIAAFNNAENRHGAIIAVLLISGAAAEGLDLKRIRHVHIMEPFWNYARISQVKTRAIRYKSHADMPPEEKNVQVYIYLSDYPEGYPEEKKTEPSTDVDLYTKSQETMRLIDEFGLVLAETSIDCTAHWKRLPRSIQEKVKCKLCSPNDVQLFHPNITKDMEMPCSCEPYSEQKVSVKEIVIPDTNEKYYYSTDPKTSAYKLYLFNPKINGYTAMPRSHYRYADIMEQLIAAAPESATSSETQDT